MRDREKVRDRKLLKVSSQCKRAKPKAQRPYPKKKPGEEGPKEKVY